MADVGRLEATLSSVALLRQMTEVASFVMKCIATQLLAPRAGRAGFEVPLCAEGNAASDAVRRNTTRSSVQIPAVTIVRRAVAVRWRLRCGMAQRGTAKKSSIRSLSRISTAGVERHFAAYDHRARMIRLRSVYEIAGDIRSWWLCMYCEFDTAVIAIRIVRFALFAHIGCCRQKEGDTFVRET